MNAAEMAEIMLGWDIKGPDDMGRLMKEHFPHARQAEVKRAVEITVFELRERARREQAEAAAMRALQKLDSDVPDTEADTLGGKLRVKAARGSRQAQAILDRWNSREDRVATALFEAAADRHPDFTRADRGWRYSGKEQLPDDVSAWLVDWFQRTHPREARAIEDAID